MYRLVIALPALLAFLVGAVPALAWTWPVEGPVLHHFALGSDPFAGGQHRGVDIGAPAGLDVRAPAGGVITFAGTVPRAGKVVTITTPDGYAITLVHLGALAVEEGAPVAEGDPVAFVGTSGEAEHAVPYLHLGVRVAADENGYLDPLTFLPAATVEGAVPAAAPPETPAGVEADPASPVTQGRDAAPAPLAEGNSPAPPDTDGPSLMVVADLGAAVPVPAEQPSTVGGGLETPLPPATSPGAAEAAPVTPATSDVRAQPAPDEPASSPLASESTTSAEPATSLEELAAPPARTATTHMRATPTSPVSPRRRASPGSRRVLGDFPGDRRASPAAVARLEASLSGETERIATQGLLPEPQEESQVSFPVSALAAAGGLACLALLALRWRRGPQGESPIPVPGGSPRRGEGAPRLETVAQPTPIAPRTLAPRRAASCRRKHDRGGPGAPSGLLRRSLKSSDRNEAAVLARQALTGARYEPPYDWRE
jgi:Peptidase family M23